jgi:exopolyphosphatase/guanosine-5'-triphosphate,3'-diphosphate pyrophosphatase
MLVAVIDLGTNTFNLIIAELNNDKTFTKKFQRRAAVKLGEGSINSGYISKVAFERGIQTVLEFKKEIDSFKVDRIRALGTSAIRSASNGRHFVEEVKRQSGISVDVISGEREAELIYYGNRLAISMFETPSLIMDIGGGSTEFIIANKNEILWKHSFLLGAARLLDQFKPEDPISDGTIFLLENHFREKLTILSAEMKKHSVSELIGSSGAFDSFVDMIGEEYGIETQASGKTEYVIDLEKYFEISKRTIHSTLAERMTMHGLIQMRVDMIVLSYLFVDLIINEFGIKKLRASTYSLKEGVLAEMIFQAN